MVRPGIVCIALALTGSACTATELPLSTSRDPVPTPEARLTVDGASVLLDGVAVADLGGDTLPTPDALTAAGSELQSRASELSARAASRGEPFRGRLALSLPPEAPSGTLLRLLDQAASAGFSKPWLQVEDRRGRTWGIALTLPTRTTSRALRSEQAAPDPAAAVQAGFANPIVRLHPTEGIRLSARDEVIDPGGHGVVIPCPTTPCTAWPTAELNRLVRRLKLDHPRDRAVLVVPADPVPVQILVDTLDATRDDAVTARGSRALLPEAVIAGEAP